MSASTGKSLCQVSELTITSDTSQTEDVKAIYKIPDWFRKHNILTKTDLEVAQNKLTIVDHASEDDDHPVPQDSDKKKSQSDLALELTRKTYQDVYELAASTLVPVDSASDARLPVLLLRGTDVDGGDVLDGIVKQLARDLDATMVSLAMYDLEDLGRAFHKQIEHSKVEDVKVADEAVQGGDSETIDTAKDVMVGKDHGDDGTQKDESEPCISSISGQHHEEAQEFVSDETCRNHQKLTSDASDTSSEKEVVYTPRSSTSDSNSQPETSASTSSTADLSGDLRASNNTSSPVDQSNLSTSKGTNTDDPKIEAEVSADTKDADNDNDSDVASHYSELEPITDINELKDNPNILDIKRFTTYATYYFSRTTPLRRNTKLVARESRNRDAVNAIMDAALQKGLHQTLEKDTESTTGPESNEAPRPIFISLRSAFDIMEHPWTEHILVTIRDKINEWRKEKNVTVTLFASIFEDIEPFVSTSKCSCRSCHSQKDIPNTREIDLRDDLFVENSYVVTIHDTSSMNNVAYYESYGSQILKGSNTRRLVQAIEGRLSKKDFAHLIGEEDRGHKFMDMDSGAFQLLTRYQPDFEELKSYATMLRGRVLENKELRVSDLEEVVGRLVLGHTETCEFARAKLKDINDEKKGKISAFKTMIAKIRKECKGFEKDLLECVIDPGTLTTSYTEVIIDPTTKTTLHRLINVSKFKFPAESHRLLQNLKTKGVLFYGPPGTGKTHLSRAIAKNSGANMLAIDGADVTHKWTGESEKYIKAAFSLARKLAPCVLFMDEVESLLFRRGSSDRRHQRAALTQFLSEMDGLSSGSSAERDRAPFLICATNRPDDLDQAFLRRLPRKVLFTMPSKEEREAIIRLYLDEKDLEDVTIEDIAGRTKGYSGSDLKGVCQGAAWAWMNEFMDEAEGDSDSDDEEDGATETKTGTGTGTKLIEETETKSNDSTTPLPQSQSQNQIQPQDPDTTDLKAGVTDKSDPDSNSELESAPHQIISTSTSASAPASASTSTTKGRSFILTKHHIDVALKTIRPSVTSDTLRYLESFARRFNPEMVGRLVSGAVVEERGYESIYL